MKKTILTIIFAGILKASPASAFTFSLETDPMPYFLNGYSVHTQVSFEKLSHWRFGMGGFYMEYPEFMINLEPDNKDKGWNVHMHGMAFAVEYYLKRQTEGLFMGAAFLTGFFEVSNNNVSNEKINYTSFLPTFRIGYRWLPFKDNGFYILPWFGLGVTASKAPDTQVGSMEYVVNRVTPLVSLHVGYEFNFQ